MRQAFPAHPQDTTYRKRLEIYEAVSAGSSKAESQAMSNMSVSLLTDGRKPDGVYRSISEKGIGQLLVPIHELISPASDSVPTDCFSSAEERVTPGSGELRETYICCAGHS